MSHLTDLCILGQNCLNSCVCQAAAGNEVVQSLVLCLDIYTFGNLISAGHHGDNCHCVSISGPALSISAFLLEMMWTLD